MLAKFIDRFLILNSFKTSTGTKKKDGNEDAAQDKRAQRAGMIKGRGRCFQEMLVNISELEAAVQIISDSCVFCWVLLGFMGVEKNFCLGFE